jgi:cytochrome c
MVMVRTIVQVMLVSAVTVGWSHGAAADGDPAKGEKIFNRCAVCHGIGDKRAAVGPNLNGVIGRTAGTQADFVSKYSKAMLAAGEAGEVWTEAEIDIYITDPKKKIPGNKMSFPGIKNAQDRADVIAYIKQFSEAPSQ